MNPIKVFLTARWICMVASAAFLGYGMPDYATTFAVLAILATIDLMDARHG